jgi:hypothetical protein
VPTAPGRHGLARRVLIGLPVAVTFVSTANFTVRAGSLAHLANSGTPPPGRLRGGACRSVSCLVNWWFRPPGPDLTILKRGNDPKIGK